MNCAWLGCTFQTVDHEYCPRHKPKADPLEPKKKGLAQVSKKRQMQNQAKKDGDPEMEQFWEKAEQELALHPYCMECDAFIPERPVRKPDGPPVANINLYRAATAHIFPKSIFISIMKHRLNRLFLCSTNGCHDKSHRLDTFSQMKVFPIAVENFRQLEPLIKERHKYLTEFKKYADQLNNPKTI